MFHLAEGKRPVKRLNGVICVHLFILLSFASLSLSFSSSQWPLGSAHSVMPFFVPLSLSIKSAFRLASHSRMDPGHSEKMRMLVFPFSKLAFKSERERECATIHSSKCMHATSHSTLTVCACVSRRIKSCFTSSEENITVFFNRCDFSYRSQQWQERKRKHVSKSNFV